MLRSLDLRYVGQSFEMPVDVSDLLGSPDARDRVRDRFHELHRQQYGYALPSKAIELVNIRVQGASAAPEGFWPRRSVAGAARPVDRRRVLFAGAEPAEWPVWRHADLPAGQVLSGPAIVEYPGSTFVLPPSWTGRVGAVGDILAEKN
jgi:N-methylhydantoinase A